MTPEKLIAELRAWPNNDGLPDYSVASISAAMNQAATTLEGLVGERDNWQSRAAERDAECERRFRAQHDAEARATAAEAALEELRGEVVRTIAEQLVRHPNDDAWARGRRCGIADVSEALAASLVSRVKGGNISSRDMTSSDDGGDKSSRCSLATSTLRKSEGRG